MPIRRIKSDDFAKLFPEIKNAMKIFTDLEKLRVSKKLPSDEFDSFIEDFRINLNKSDKVQTRFNENQGAYLYKALLNRINKYFNPKNNKSKREVIADDKQIQTESNKKTWRERKDQRNSNEWTKETLEELGTVLKPLQVEIIKLTIFEGYPYKEIVAIIENKFQEKYSEEYLRTIYSRSMKQLRNHPGIEGMLQLIAKGLLFDEDKIEKMLIQTGVKKDAAKELTKEFEEMCFSSEVAFNPFEVLCDVLLIKEQMPDEFKNEGDLDDYIWILMTLFILDRLSKEYEIDYKRIDWQNIQLELSKNRLDKLNEDDNRAQVASFYKWIIKNNSVVKISTTNQLRRRMPAKLAECLKEGDEAKITGANLLNRFGL